MSRALALIGVGRACRNCKNFDLEAGQAGIASSSPAFVAAASILTPEQIAATALTDAEREAEVAHIRATEAALEAGQTPPPLPEILVAVAARVKAAEKPDKVLPWKVSEFGACAKRPEEAVWQGWKCEDWA